MFRKFTLAGMLAGAFLHSAHAQYAPPPGQAGTTAMYKDSSAFKGWATECTVERGWQNISDQAGGYASAGESSLALDAPGSNGVVSLGDGGSATVSFERPVANGPGYDFAVFENGFSDDFLELAFVEVSSDGINFFRFPSVSLTDVSSQKAAFDLLDTRKIHNLAGKYRAMYGTPFDLEELKDKEGLDVNAITHIRITDVVGSIGDAYATYDSEGHKVNDPWPTAFPSGGFDLDAVGVIHFADPTAVSGRTSRGKIEVYPNPVHQGQYVKLDLGDFSGREVMVEVFGPSGDKVKEQWLQNPEEQFSLESIPTGIYLLKVNTGEAIFTGKLVVR